MPSEPQPGMGVPFTMAGRGFPVPFWYASSAALYLGDVRRCLRTLPARSIHTVITSPPYWNLRDYGTGTWEGGSVGCDHTPDKTSPRSTLEGGKETQGSAKEFRAICHKCGARRTDQQIGMETSPDCDAKGQAQCGNCFVCSMVDVFREVKRVLRDDGTLWLNLGDTFDNGQLLIPSRVALALRADGWVLVQDIIWYSPNKMPESVTSRCTKSHEHIFLLAKSSEYYFDAVAIMEECKSDPRSNTPKSFMPTSGKDKLNVSSKGSSATRASMNNRSDVAYTHANKRDVWIVSSKGYPGAHYATFSPELITPCILSGTSEHGCCAQCGSPYTRVVTKVAGASADRPVDGRDRSFNWSRNGLPGSSSTLDGIPSSKVTVGWQKTCACHTSDVAPCIVLDPFAGSGTTVATALEQGRKGVGIDLSEVYLRDNAIPRIEAAMRGERVRRKPTVALRPGLPLTPKRLP